ncbi:MAG TPA: hypothetical protein VGL00_06485 [Terracidiphilus sp.]
MTLHWADLAFMVAIVVAGCGASCFLVLVRLRRMLAEQQRDMYRRLAALTEAVAMRPPAASEAPAETDALTEAEIETEAPAGFPGFLEARTDVRENAAPTVAVDEDAAELPAEIRVAIAAAAIAAFGNHARVRSARRVPSSDVVSPWTQQGRVIVQSSHNLRARG